MHSKVLDDTDAVHLLLCAHTGDSEHCEAAVGQFFVLHFRKVLWRLHVCLVLERVKTDVYARTIGNTSNLDDDVDKDQRDSAAGPICNQKSLTAGVVIVAQCEERFGGRHPSNLSSSDFARADEEDKHSKRQRRYLGKLLVCRSVHFEWDDKA